MVTSRALIYVFAVFALIARLTAAFKAVSEFVKVFRNLKYSTSVELVLPCRLTQSASGKQMPVKLLHSSMSSHTRPEITIIVSAYWFFTSVILGL